MAMSGCNVLQTRDICGEAFQGAIGGKQSH